MGGGITQRFRPWTHTSDDSYISQLSLVVATATVSWTTTRFILLYKKSLSVKGQYHLLTLRITYTLTPAYVLYHEAYGFSAVDTSGPGVM